MQSQLYKIYSSRPLDEIYYDLVAKLGFDKIGAIRLDYNWNSDGTPSVSNRTICVASPDILTLSNEKELFRIEPYTISLRSQPPRHLSAHLYIEYPPLLLKQSDRFQRVTDKVMALVTVGWLTSRDIRILNIGIGAIVLFNRTVELSKRIQCYVLLKQLTWMHKDKNGKVDIEISRTVWCPRRLIPSRR